MANLNNLNSNLRYFPFLSESYFKFVAQPLVNAERVIEHGAREVWFFSIFIRKTTIFRQPGNECEKY